MHNTQFNGERNSYENITERLRRELFDLDHAGLPDNDSNLIQLLQDARLWILQARQDYGISEYWSIRSPAELLDD